MLLDKILLNFYLSFFQKKPLPHFIDKDEDRTKLNPIFDSFKTFSWLTLLDIDFKSSIEYLTDVRDLEIQTKNVYLDPKTSEELEALTNPDFYLKGIDCVFLRFKESLSLTNKFFQNIREINPNRLKIMFNKLEDETDYISILTKVKWCNEVQLINNTLDGEWMLCFSDVFILVKLNNQDPVFVKCSKFSCYVEMWKINEDFWVSKGNSTDINNENQSYLHILRLSKYEFTDHKQVYEKEEIAKLRNKFSSCLSEFKDQWEFIIPIWCLESIDFEEKEALCLVKNEQERTFMKEIQDVKTSSWSIEFAKFLQHIIKSIPMLYSPSCVYSFKNRISFQKEISKLGQEQLSKLVEQLSTTRISELKFMLVLSTKELKLVKGIICSRNSKAYLSKVSLNLTNLDDAIDVLYLLLECMNIKFVEIRYQNNYISKSLKADDVIREAKNLFTKKVDITWEVRITQISKSIFKIS